MGLCWTSCVLYHTSGRMFSLAISYFYLHISLYLKVIEFERVASMMVHLSFHFHITQKLEVKWVITSLLTISCCCFVLFLFCFVLFCSVVVVFFLIWCSFLVYMYIDPHCLFQILREIVPVVFILTTKLCITLSHRRVCGL